MTAPTFVNAGTASSTDGGSRPTPGLPASVTMDDLMVLVVYSRHTGTGQVSVSGWTTVLHHTDYGGLLAIFMRRFVTGDSAPAIGLTGFTGGVSGDDVIAQIAAWRSVDYVRQLTALSSNPAAGNIGPLLATEVAENDVVVVVGGKQDDWTSVATLSGDGLTWVEIGEPVSTAGADAGMVWDYAINGATKTTVSAKTFSVTGGTSQAGKGVVLGLLNTDDQILMRARRAKQMRRMAGVA